MEIFEKSNFFDPRSNRYWIPEKPLIYTYAWTQRLHFSSSGHNITVAADDNSLNSTDFLAPPWTTLQRVPIFFSLCYFVNISTTDEYKNAYVYMCDNDGGVYMCITADSHIVV